MDFRDNGFSIDGKSILIDGNPWGLNPGTNHECVEEQEGRQKDNGHYAHDPGPLQVELLFQAAPEAQHEPHGCRLQHKQKEQHHETGGERTPCGVSQSHVEKEKQERGGDTDDEQPPGASHQSKVIAEETSKYGKFGDRVTHL